jgi:serine protease Do
VSALFSAALLGSVVAFAPFADAAEPSAMPPSLAAVAQAARAASIVVRNAEEEDVATSVLAQDESDRDEGDIVASRRRTVAAGIIVDPRGYALTNARAVLRVRNFEIALIDGVVVKATLVGLDRPTDMALLKLEPPDSGGALPYLVIGDSARANVGDWVIAIGAPRGFEGTVTAGIITALPAPGSRSPVAGFIQTDAAMSRGSAGGALVTATGEVIGLLSVLSGDGIGYVVPSTTVRRIYLELLETGHVSRPWLGRPAAIPDARPRPRARRPRRCRRADRRHLGRQPGGRGRAPLRGHRRRHRRQHCLVSRPAGARDRLTAPGARHEAACAA